MIMKDFRTRWLTELGQRLHIPNLAFDEAHFCQLVLNDAFTITIHQPAEKNYLVLFGQFAIRDISGQLLQKMMIENRFHMRETAPVLSLSPEGDKLEIHYKITEEELNKSGDIMGQLITAIEFWRTECGVQSS